MRHTNRADFDKRLTDIEERIEKLKTEHSKIKAELEEFEKISLMKSVVVAGLSVDEAIEIIKKNTLKTSEPEKEEKKLSDTPQPRQQQPKPAIPSQPNQQYQQRPNTPHGVPQILPNGDNKNDIKP